VSRNWPWILGALTGPIGLAVVAITKHWDKIRGAFTAAKDWVVGAFSRAWSAAKSTVLAPVNAARDAISRLFGSGGPVRGAFSSVKDWVIGAFKREWNGLKNIFTGPVTAARDVISKVLGWEKNGLRNIFSDAVSAIGHIWDGLKDKAKAPIRFVIETVLNRGLIDGFNLIAGVLPGVGKIKHIPLPRGFSEGGYTGSLPVDRVAGVVHGDEFVTRAESRRRIERTHPGLLDHINTFGALPGYRDGGLVGKLKGGADWVKEGVKGIAGKAKDFVLGNLKKAAGALLGPIFSQLGKMRGNLLGDLSFGLMSKARDALLGMAGKNDAQGVLSGGAFARGGKWPPAIQGRVAANTAAAVEFVRRTFGISNIGTLGARPNKSDHPMGKALDVMIPNWRTPIGIRQGNSIASTFTGNPHMFGTKYVIWRGRINSGSGWRPYTHPNGPTNNPTLQHMDHVHVSLFDQGGWLKPGQAAMNMSGRPEPILSPQQYSTLLKLADGGTRTAPMVSIGTMNTTDPKAAIREMERRQSDAVALANLRGIK
jgi:hypothetical protein